MEFYLYGSPISTRRNEWTDTVQGVRRESEHLALIHRASSLHQSSPTGLSIKAARLKVRGTVFQLRTARGGHKLLLLWIRLSDGSGARLAWYLEPGEGRLYAPWTRVEWSQLVFPTKTRKSHPRASKPA